MVIENLSDDQIEHISVAQHENWLAEYMHDVREHIFTIVPDAI